MSNSLKNEQSFSEFRYLKGDIFIWFIITKVKFSIFIQHGSAIFSKLTVLKLTQYMAMANSGPQEPLSCIIHS